MAEFYVTDENGNQLPDEMTLQVCELPNYFSTFNYAMKACKKVSKKFEGRFSVAVACPTVYFENGREMED